MDSMLFEASFAGDDLFETLIRRQRLLGGFDSDTGIIRRDENADSERRRFPHISGVPYRPATARTWADHRWSIRPGTAWTGFPLRRFPDRSCDRQ